MSFVLLMYQPRLGLFPDLISDLLHFQTWLSVTVKLGISCYTMQLGLAVKLKSNPLYSCPCSSLLYYNLLHVVQISFCFLASAELVKMTLLMLQILAYLRICRSSHGQWVSILFLGPNIWKCDSRCAAELLLCSLPTHPSSFINLTYDTTWISWRNTLTPREWRPVALT